MGSQGTDRTASAPVTRAPASTAPMSTRANTKARPEAVDQDRRAAAAAAAERRKQESSRRGTTTANPNHGSLAQKLDQQRKSPLRPEEQLPERVVWD